ncbi:MAG: hypothetical protein HUJ96_06380 [Marinilabiliaceae bacterium]|nr:hypothetical protein [Marinilabiliaceae bacterium]
MLKQTLLLSAILCGTGLTAQTAMPLVFDKENTAPTSTITMPDVDALPVCQTLPNPLVLSSTGKEASNLAEWEERRADIMAQIQHYEIGPKPTITPEQLKARFEADTLVVDITVNNETLTLRATVKRPEGDGPFPALIGIGWGGTGSLPKEIFESRPIATITFNFSQVMQHTQKRGTEPINRLYPDLTYFGAYAAWPWGISRIIDALQMLGPDVTRIDTSHLAVTGCSFAGKMALFAGAFDERIALTIAQEPGGGGVDAWRVSETLGHVETLGRTSHEWFMESMFRFAEENVSRLPHDHHELAALIAPRALLVIGNTDYEWLAEQSSYVSSQAAHTVWEHFGIGDRMGFSILGGHMHCQLPKEQWPEVEAFVDKFLLGKAADTNVMKADMFKDVDLSQWINW